MACWCAIAWYPLERYCARVCACVHMCLGLQSVLDTILHGTYWCWCAMGELCVHVYEWLIFACCKQTNTKKGG